MKNITGWLKGLLGLGALIALIVGLVTILGPASTSAPRGQGASPTRTPPPQSQAPTQTPRVQPPVSPIQTPTPIATLTLETIPVPPEILDGEKIVFLQDKNLQIINVGSRTVAPVTVSDNVSQIFGWSHDGSKILLGVGEYPVLPETDMLGGTDLWALNADGTNPLQLTKGLEVLNAQWSPMKNEITYITRNAELYKTDSEGVKLQHLASKVIDDLAWSPTGTKLAFKLMPSTWQPGQGSEIMDIATLDLIEGQITQLTSNAAENFHPVWSIDGKSILFESGRGYYVSGMKLWYVMNANGNDVRHLETPPLPASSNLTRSSKANQVAFDIGGSVWIMDFQGNTQEIAEGSAPSWSPDGNKLAYVGKDRGIWVIDIHNKKSIKLNNVGHQLHWTD